MLMVDGFKTAGFDRGSTPAFGTGFKAALVGEIIF